MTSRQRAVLAYVALNPGCSIADVVRAEWKGKGHAASYARVKRLVASGRLRMELVKGDGHKARLSLPDVTK